MTMTIDGSNGFSLDGQFNSASSFGFKNRIINGAMQIDQRNAGASVTPNNSYTLDRWLGGNTQTGKFTIQQVSSTLSGFINALKATSSSAYSVLAGDSFYITHRVEGLNSSDLSWGTANAKTVTLSFWVQSSLTGTFGGSITNGDTNHSYPFSYTISSANTWEYKTITIVGPTGGSWYVNNGVGVQLVFSLGTGSTYSGTAGSWATGAYLSATGATSVVGTNGATFYITGVQLEKGSTATSFDYRPYGTELALCQRYYETGKEPYSYVQQFSTLAATVAFGDCRFAVTKRASPSITFSGWKYWSVTTATAFTPALDTANVDKFSFNGNPLTSWTGWREDGTWTASAEL